MSLLPNTIDKVSNSTGNIQLVHDCDKNTVPYSTFDTDVIGCHSKETCYIPLYGDSDRQNPSRRSKNKRRRPTKRKFNMLDIVRQWRQFWLLMSKNWILVRRNKMWTMFELIIPIALTLPIVLMVVKFANISDHPVQTFAALPVSGDASDINRRFSFSGSIAMQWCSKKTVKLAYYTSLNNAPGVDNIMTDLRKRYLQKIEIELVKFTDSDKFVEELRLDYGKLSPEVRYCGVHEYVGGVRFDTLDEDDVSYQIFLPNPTRDYGSDTWKIEQNWDEPYGADYHLTSLPEPPYWPSGFLSLQYAIDSIFIEGVGMPKNNITHFSLQRLPEDSYRVNSVAAFIQFLPVLWGIFVYLTVIHTAREIAAEKAEIKPFLHVMGLSRYTFYASHIVFAWIKCCLIFLACAIPLAYVLTNVSISLFFVLVFLYGLGAVCMAAFIAAIFKTSNSTIKVVLIVWILSVLVVYIWKTLRADQVALCFLASLNINHAFYFGSLAMNDYMTRDWWLILAYIESGSTTNWTNFSHLESFLFGLREIHNKLGIIVFASEIDLTWGNMFANSTTKFSMGWSMVMLVVDIIWMWGTTLLLDYWLSETGPSLKNLFTSPDNTVEDTTDGSSNGHTEEDAGQSLMTKTVKIRNLSKLWETTGEKAVNNISLDICEGQVTALLGHNGAGKSTTFSMISGVVKPTTGSIHICNQNLEQNPTLCQQQIGYCPQGNCLFEKLTVMEHLWLVHGLKGGSHGGSYREQAVQLTKSLKLTDMLAHELSGGMKRKLCVCMAMIGNSKVILLDEPTAGMDPEARHDVERLLEEQKNDRAVLLTTHYMDEAEVLGDRVAIMVKGSMVYVGSVEHLKKKYGAGYILTFVLSQLDEKNERNDRQKQRTDIMEIVNTYITDATANLSGNQLEVILPLNQQDRFVDLFEVLESTDHFNNFGVSVNTLEQVFIKVGESVEQRETSDREEVKDIDTLIDSQSYPVNYGMARLIQQLAAIVTKKFNYARRNWPQLIIQVIIPLILLAVVAYMSGRSSTLDFVSTSLERTFDVTSFGPARVIVQNVLDTELIPVTIGDHYNSLLENAPDVLVVPVLAGENVSTTISHEVKDIPAPAFGVILRPNNHTILFSARAHHSLPTSMNLYSNARLRAEKKKGSITTSLHIYNPESVVVDTDPDAITDPVIDPSKTVDVLLGPLLVLAFSLLTSTFVMFLVEERASKFAHQQHLTGISPAVFWGGSLLYDVLFYMVACSMFLLFFAVFGWLENYKLIVVLVWVVYFWSCVPFIYAVSFMFSSASKANVLLILWQLVAAFVAFIILNLAPVLLVDGKIIEVVKSFLLFLLPSFAMGQSVITVGSMSAQSLPPADALKWENIGRSLVFMVISGALSAALFLSFQFKAVRKAFYRMWTVKRTRGEYSTVNGVMDECVKKEGDLVKELVDSTMSRSRTTSSTVSSSDAMNYVLLVHELEKYYGNFRAVDNLSLGVKRNECFGLLGRNGAGKTSTFDILTGQSFPSAGIAWIDGMDVVADNIPIGYCPQFDAFMTDFSGSQILTTLASLHGFKDPKSKANLVLRCVGLTDNAHKLTRYYSGGQRRKLSVGISLLATTKIIILDEPTAGIDPKARRDIWTLLSGFRDKSQSALMLTSHSMDECEALCHRIGILKKGTLAAIGSIQHLKNAYGKELMLSMKTRSHMEREELRKAVADEFGDDADMKTHTDSKSLRTNWLIKKREGHKWSVLWKKVVDVANTVAVDIEYTVAQPSLEYVFLRASQDGISYSDGTQ